MTQSIYKPLCGLHDANVVVSEYNWNGTCKCLNCNPCTCQTCSRYKELLDESTKKDQLRLERCLACLKQK